MTVRDRWVYWGLLVLALGLRLVTLGDRPFDGDEGVIGRITDGTLGDVIRLAGAIDVHPPLYHGLVWLSRQLFGVSEWSLRFVGVLAGTGLVALAPALGRTLAVDWRLLGLLLATSPFLVYTSQDARMYSLLIVVATAGWLQTLRLTPTTGWAAWLVWAMLNVALVYTHHLGWVVLGLEVLTLVIANRAVVVRSWQRLVVSLGVILLAYLPQLATTVGQFEARLAEQSTGASISERVSGLVGAGYRMVAGRTFLDLNPRSLGVMATDEPLLLVAFLLTLIVPFGVAWLGFQALSTTWRRLLTGWFGLSLGLGLVVGTVAIQASRYLAFLAPLLLLCLALGLARLWPKVWGKVVVVIVAFTVLAGLWTQYARHNQAAGMWDVAAVVDELSAEQDVVYLHGAFAGGETWAYQRYDRTERSVVDHFASYQPGNLDELRAVQPADRIDELLNEHPRIWFVDQTYSETLLDSIDTQYQVIGMAVGTDKEGIPLVVWQVKRQ